MGVALQRLKEKVFVESDSNKILRNLLSQVRVGDTIIFMSNGDFQGIVPTFIELLNAKEIPQ